MKQLAGATHVEEGTGTFYLRESQGGNWYRAHYEGEARGWQWHVCGTPSCTLTPWAVWAAKHWKDGAEPVEAVLPCSRSLDAAIEHTAGLLSLHGEGMPTIALRVLERHLLRLTDAREKQLGVTVDAEGTPG